MALPWHGGINGASHRLSRLCLALLTVSSGAASALAEEAIRWQRVDGVVVSGSGLAKAPGATIGGGTSAQVVKSGEGYARFVVGEGGAAKAMGLATVPRNSAASLRFGFQLGSDGGVSVVENGATQAQLGTYNGSDEFRVGVEGTAVVYRQNAAVVYTSAASPAYPLFAQVVLIDDGTISSSAMGGALAEQVEWTNVGPHILTASGSLTRLEGTGPSEGAVSTRGINSANGYLEFRASDNGIMGLSNGDTDGLEDDIDFGLEFWYGSLYVVENGEGRGQFGTVTSSDLLRVSVENGVVVYRKNGAVIYTSTTPPQYPLVVDASFDSTGASASSVVLSGVLVDVATSGVQLNPSGGTYASAQSVTVSTVTSGATIYYTLDGSEPTTSSPVVSNGGTVPVTSSDWLRARAYSAGRWPSSTRSDFYALGNAVSTELAEWTNVGPHILTASGSLTRLEDATEVWEGAVSTRGINSPNGYLEFRASAQGAMGLNNGDTDGLEDDIDFGLEFWYGSLYVVENGEGKGQFGTVTSSDVLRVSVENGVVVYRKNGAVIYTSTTPPQYPLVVDSSLDSFGASVWSVMLSGVLVDVATSEVQLNPPGGAYAAAQTVTISTATTGATIYYTLDGSAPTTSSPAVSNGGTVPLTASGWLRTRAYSAGRWPSSTRSDFYALGSAVSAEQVEWTNVGPHLLAAPGSLTRLQGTGSPEGAVSTRGIGSPNGYLEFRMSDNGTLGLSNGDTNGLEDDIDFGLASWYESLYVVENGEGTDVGTVTSSDVLRISVENGVVVYRKNGAVIYTSTTPPQYPLVADASFDNTGGSASSVVLSGVLVDSRPPPPAIAPPAGAYQAAINVVLSAPSGVLVRYTTNGVDPTPSSPVYSSPIPIAVSSAVTTIKALSTRAGYVPSGIVSAIYNFGPATPTFAPPSGAYNANQAVAISTATAGATIRYTTNGSTPTASSTLYSSPVSITQTTTLNAKAFLAGLPDSLTGTAVYTLAPVAPTLTPNGGVFAGTQSVTMTTSTSGSSIRYTTNGSTPTATSTLYSAAISVTTPTTIKAAAFKTNWAMSAVTTATFTPTVATPTFSPVAGTYTANQNVTIATTTAGDAIRYTLDGSDPTATSTLYTAAVAITQTTTLKAKGFLTNWANSATGTALYTLNATAPTFTPNGGPLTAVQTITLATTTAGASIRYTTNGTAPTASSTLYAAPFTLSGPATVKAATFKAGWTTSGVTSAAFTTTVATPTFSPVAGTYAANQTVTISTTPGAAIRYTTNGTTPTASSTLYTAPVAITQTTTLKAIGILSGWTNSLVGTAAYTMAASAPTFTPSSGNLPSGQSIAMATATTGGAIRYTTNGTTPTASSTLYSAPISISAPITLKAATFKTGWTTSGVTTAAFTPTVATPTFSPVAGTYNANQTVTISTTTSGDTIRYTLDGSDPTTSSAAYSTPLSITATTTLKAKGFLASWANSATGTAVYTITGVPPTFTPNGGTFMGSQSVTMTTTTSGASIRYTTDGTTPTADLHPVLGRDHRHHADDDQRGDVQDRLEPERNHHGDIHSYGCDADLLAHGRRIRNQPDGDDLDRHRRSHHPLHPGRKRPDNDLDAVLSTRGDHPNHDLEGDRISGELGGQCSGYRAVHNGGERTDDHAEWRDVRGNAAGDDGNDDGRCGDSLHH